MLTIPTLETERLILRGFTENDFETFVSVLGDEEWSKFVGGPLPREKAWRVLATDIGHWVLRGYGMFAVEEKQSGKCIGMVGHWDPEGWPEPEIAYTLDRSAAGKGYAVEAVKAVLDHTFNTLKWDTVVSYIDPENSASRKVAGRVGAVAEDLIDLAGYPTRVHRHPTPNK